MIKKARTAVQIAYLLPRGHFRQDALPQCAPWQFDKLKIAITHAEEGHLAQNVHVAIK